ncbi:Leucine-rich_repeat protein [Hexamita inflata]|uniref:Leucine-rich repeat protein n=1 Tax=Hexamita inflata TaxID=28002 RepID=A0AA86QIV2_9EUKA|nr:Leucine-rich repeat protein [Hexamita inflata]
MALTKEIILKQAKTFSYDVITRLSLVNLQLTGIELIRELPQLFYLNVSSNQIRDVDCVFGLKQLQIFIADQNAIQSISPTISPVQFLSLKNNRFTQTESVSFISTFKSLSILNLIGNEVSKSPEFLQFVLNNSQIRSLNQIRIRLLNGQIIANNSKQVEPEQLIDEDLPLNQWVEKFENVDAGDFEADFGADEQRVKDAIKGFWDEQKKE